MTSEHFLTAAKITLILLLAVQAARVWDATARHCDKLRRARAIAKIRRERENRHRQMAWTFCVLAADGQIPSPTRRITAAEWRGASADIQRELSRSEQFEEANRRC